jgi:hypothetical protein
MNASQERLNNLRTLFRWHDRHTKSHKDRIRHLLRFRGEGGTHTGQGDMIGLLFYFFKIRKVE